MRKWEYLVLVENVRSLKSLEDLAKDDELYADQLRQGNYAPSLNKYGDQGWEFNITARRNPSHCPKGFYRGLLFLEMQDITVQIIPSRITIL